MKNGTSILDTLFHNLDLRYWAVFLAAAFYVGAKNPDQEPIKRRLTKVGVNAGLAFGFSKDLSAYLWGSEMAAVIILMSAGWIILDIITGIISDPDLIKKLVRQKLGVDDKDDK